MRQARRCPVCKKEAAANKKFCPFDGTPLEDVLVDDELPPPGPRLSYTGADGTTVEYALDGGSVTIGKGENNSVVLPEPTVSRSHATVKRDGDVYTVFDNGSSNGVFVNEERVAETGRRLANGDVVRLGRAKLTFYFEGQPKQKRTTNRDRIRAQTGVDAAAGTGLDSNSELMLETSREGFGFVDVVQSETGSIRVPVRARDVTVGRSPDSDIVLNDATVSRRQARFTFDGAVWRVANVGANPIYANGSPVGPEGVEVRFGDEITVGAARLRLSLYRNEVGLPLPPAAGNNLATAQRMAVAPVESVPFKVRDTGELSPEKPVERAGAPAFVIDGKYEIESKIAEVSTGTIYRARRVALGDRVAVRVLRPDLVQHATAVERFRRQAQVAARIRHPNVVQVYDFGVSSEGAVFIVEELLSGRTLRDLVSEQRGLTLSRIVSLFNQICGAVQAANMNGIVLRDLKPGSIFLERAADGREVVKVGGFGLAKITSGEGSGGMTVASQAKFSGTPEYMSPEQWLDEPLDSRSDVYSLGVILFELLTGTVPYSGTPPMQVAQLHLSAPVPNVAAYGRPDLDEGVATVVSRALSKDKNLRQPNAVNLASEFEAVAGASRGVVQSIIGRATGRVPVMQPYAPVAAAPVPAGEPSLPSVIAQPEATGRGPANPVVLALLVEAFLSRISSGLVKTSVPLFALLVFGFDIASIMILVLIQNVVPLLLRPAFGTLADKYGKKRIFLLSLSIRTVVSVLYAVAVVPWLFYLISVVRGIADSAKGPSASAMIADNTDEKHIATAYSWYTTVKSTSGGIGEAIAAFMLVVLISVFAGLTTVTVNVAVLDELAKNGQPKEEVLKSPGDVAADGTIPAYEASGSPRHVARVEQRQMRLKDVAIDDLPKVVDATPLRYALVAIFLASTVLSALSLLLVAVVIKEKKKDKSEKKEKKPEGAPGAMVDEAGARPSVWAFALLGTALTAPAYMVTGEFFTILAVKLEVTPGALGWIKILAETAVPLIFGPVFGWVADRIGAGKVIAMRSVANMATSLLFWITPWFVGTALLGVMMGLARGVDEIGKAAFKPTWGAIAAKVSSFDLTNRSRTMGILEGGVDASDLAFPVLAGVLLQYLSLGWLMAVRAVLALVAEIYAFALQRKYRI